VALVVVAVSVALAYVIVLSKPVGPGETRIVGVPDGAGAAQIAGILKREGLIRSEFTFRLAVHRHGLAGKLRAGHYELSPAMSPREIAGRLAEGRVATVKVTIPEGFTAAQAARKVDEAGLCSADAFLAPAVIEKIRDGNPFVTNDRLEGYLFPDTYIVELGSKPEQIVQQMVDNFHQQVIVGMERDLRASRYPLEEVVTIASMIEREARVPEDRALIASVICNRLARDMRLQIDATVIYALGEHRERLTYEDLKVDSPFNTYRYKGLPLHPICSPGGASLRAALRPAKTDYLYYVAKPDGSHVFTGTYEEHQRAIRAIRGGGD
jgi:UPF0755 protein